MGTRSWLLLGLGVVVIACAEGTAEDQPGFGIGNGDAGVDVTNRPSPPNKDASTSKDAASDASEPPADAAVDSFVATTCTSTVVCAASQDGGTLSGDTSAGSPITLTGKASQWIKVRVTENVNGFLSAGRSLTLGATLKSSVGSNFDLYLHELGPNDCTNPGFNSQKPLGQDDVIEVEWGETTGGSGNGMDDSRDVYFEVRFAGGPCDGGDWTLTLNGDI